MVRTQRSRFRSVQSLKRILVIVLVLASILDQNVAVGAAHVSITLYAVADNYADSKYPRSAYGHVSALYVGNSYDRAQDIWGSERIYIRFNVTELPKGHAILQALSLIHI